MRLSQIDQSVLMHICCNQRVKRIISTEIVQQSLFLFFRRVGVRLRKRPSSRLICRGLLVEEIASHRLAQSVKANKPSISSGIRNESRFCSRVLRNKSRGVFGEQWRAEILRKSVESLCTKPLCSSNLVR